LSPAEVNVPRRLAGNPARLPGNRIRRHLVPNAFGVIIVSATFTIADAILMPSVLSFLGLGLPPPAADWGSMLTNGLD
jgi:peptide/nickel transport system permease protein